MVNVIVVDDEWYTLEEICGLVAKTGWMTVVGRYQNPRQALEGASGLAPQVAFIDVEMPEMDGITLAEKLLETNPSLIVAFITAWDQYAVQAFDLNALDYVMKPIKLERFERMIEKIRGVISLNRPVPSPVLKIQCFGQLEIRIGDVPVKWERAKAQELFAYLVMNHNRYVHKDTIIEDLWPEYEYARALPILQTSICKIRHVFSALKGEVALDYAASKYCLSIHSAECDYFEVERALTGYRKGEQMTYAAVKKASQIIHQGFLTQQGYLWSLEKDEELRKTFTGVLKQIVSDYSQAGAHNATAKYLKLHLQLAPYDEEANWRLLKLYEALGEDQAIASHYLWLQRILKDEYGSLPSERLIQLVNRKRSENPLP